LATVLLEEERIELCKELMDKAKQKNIGLHLPVDSVCGKGFGPDVEAKIAKSDSIEAGWMGLDIGPEACQSYQRIIENSKTILWNGPMGVFEFEKFKNGSETVAYAVASATRNGSFSLIGGGDSAAAVNKFGLADQVSYVSTGGGALLEYFEGKQLPGIQAILEQNLES
jgi:phosphoglycerate kinase